MTWSLRNDICVGLQRVQIKTKVYSYKMLKAKKPCNEVQASWGKDDRRDAFCGMLRNAVQQHKMQPPLFGCQTFVNCLWTSQLQVIIIIIKSICVIQVISTPVLHALFCKVHVCKVKGGSSRGFVIYFGYQMTFTYWLQF